MKIRQALALVLVSFTSIAATGCGDIDRDGRDFGLAQDFAFGETGDEMGDEMGGDADAGQEADAGDPGVAGFDPQPSLECGDGIVQGREECDDGELNGINNGCTPECMFNVCGDGYQLVGIEECDTGELNGVEQNGLICTDSCEVVAPV